VSSLMQRVKNAPPAVGVVLMGIGAVGLVIPGPFGTPFLLAGGLILAPRVFRSVDQWVERKFPQCYRSGLSNVERFLADMERRYPSRPRSPESLSSSSPLSTEEELSP